MGEFADLFEEGDNPKAAMAVRLNAASSPDAAAQANNLARRYNLPPAVAETFIDDYKARAVSDDARKTFERAPRLGSWVAADPNRAKVAHDDIQTLGGIEEAIGGLTAYALGARQDGGLPTDITKAVRSVLAGAGPGFGSAVYGAAAYPLEAIGLERAGGLFRDLQRESAAVAERVAGRDPNAGFLERSVLSGFESAGRQLPTLPLGLMQQGSRLMLGAMGATTFGESYGRARDEGLSVGQAGLYGLEDATAEVVTERFLGAAGLIGDAKAGMSAARLFIRDIAREIPGEIGATLWQNFNAWANVNPDKTLNDFLAEQPEAVLQTVIATAVGAGVQTGAIRGTQKILGDSARKEAEARQAQDNAARIEQLGQLRDVSKLAQRDAETFRELMAEIADEQGDAPIEVYIDPERLTNTLNQSGITLQELASIAPVVAAQLATPTGGDIRVPVSEFMTAGEQVTAPLVDYIRTAPDAMNRIEAQEFLKTQGETLRQEIERELGQRESFAAYRDSIESLRQGFEQELSAAGRFSPDVNKAYAELLANFYGATAARLGVTPQELVQRYRIKVRSTTSSGGRALEQAPVPGDALPLEGLRDKTVAGHAVMDSSRLDAKNLADILEGTTLPPEFDRIDELPSLLRMQAAMLFIARNDEKIRGTIVKAVPVDVVNMLFGSEGAAKDALSNDPMLKDGSAFDAELAITRLRDGADPVALLVREAANVAASVDARALSAGRESKEETSALDAGQRNSFSQGDTSPLARLVFGDDITTSPSVIELLRGSTLASFIHESGHLFLEIQTDLARRIQEQASQGASLTEGEQSIVNDMETLLEWFGIKGEEGVTPLQQWGRMSLDERRESHEKFARGFEAYAMEGKSPSIALQSIFQRFRSWLIEVYKTLRSLNVELTDDVRSVMGRLIASDMEIEEAEAQRSMGPLFKTFEKSGMTLEEFNAYQGLAKSATDSAVDELATRTLKDLKWLSGARDKFIKSRQAEVEELRREVRSEVRSEVYSEPVYRAWQFLTGKGKEVLPGTQATIDPVNESGKLRTSHLKDMYGTEETAIWRKLSALRMTSEETGLSPDIVADLFGYDSGDALVRALADATPPNEVIEARTDQRMLERYGDINSEEALKQAADEAVHNEARARFIASELKALQEATRVRGGQKNSVNVLARAAKEYASEVIVRLRIRDIRPSQYAAAEARSSRLAVESLAKGNTSEAATHKRNQLVNNYATKAAYDAQAEIEKSLAFFRKVNTGNAEKIAKTRDVGLVNVARAVLAEYGLGTKGKSASEYLETVKNNDPQTYEILRDRVEVMVRDAAPYRDMSLERFNGLVAEIRDLWFLAKRGRQVEIDGKLVDKKVATEALSSRLEEIGVPARVPGEGMAVTEAERRRLKIRTAWASLRRVESWVDSMDSGKLGAFRRYVWQPVREAVDRYLVDKAQYLKKYRDILKTVDLGKSKIAAPELGYTFGHSRGGSGKQEILHAILHTGNDSNKRKLLLGRGWASLNEAGELDTSRWDAFVRRMIDEGVLTKADYDFAQSVWDLLEITKPLAQKAHRSVFGRYFDEVTASPVVTPFGMYRGGYVPAVTDSEVVRDAKTRELMEQENQSLAYAFPSTAKGFTKARVEYNKPLLLDLRSLSQHIDKVLLFSHLEQPIRDVRKILTDKTVAEPLNRIDPTAFDGLLTPWMNRVARQQVETPVPGSNGLMRFFSKARSRAGIAAMFANLSNTAQQITGLSIAAVKVKPKYLLNAAAQMIHSPRATALAVSDSSAYMSTRMDNEIAQMTDAIDDILLNPSIYDKAQTWTQKHAYFMQAAVDNVIGSIVWTGAYNQALEAGETDVNAVRLADAAVRQTQGSTLPSDVARFETGNAFVRMFTQFAGYFNMQANLLGTEFATIMREMGLRKGAGRGMYVFLLGFLAPALVSELIVQAFRGGPGDDDKDGEYLDDWLSALGLGTVRSGVAMVPVVGQAANAAINATNSKPYDDRISTSPAISMVESAVRAPASVYGAIVEDKSAKKAVKDVATLITLTTGLPATAVARPLGYLTDVAEDRVEPTGPADIARGLVTGAVSPESRQ